MQLTASKPAVYASTVCRRERKMYLPRSRRHRDVHNLRRNDAALVPLER